MNIDPEVRKAIQAYARRWILKVKENEPGEGTFEMEGSVMAAIMDHPQFDPLSVLAVTDEGKFVALFHREDDFEFKPVTPAEIMENTRSAKYPFFIDESDPDDVGMFDHWMGQPRRQEN